jgi:hypothetical protein
LVRAANLARPAIDGTTETDTNGLDPVGSGQFRNRFADLFANAFAAARFIHRTAFATDNFATAISEDELEFGAADFDAQKHGRI